ncbi:MAG: FAD-dependent oxidoreductase [Alphaproteobacteria bacterium]|nr:FAD-dependent oxidoreductase [Alphaproteobacteria bacterium]
MRLSGPRFCPVAAPIRFTVDGAPIEALPGETIAAALSAAGQAVFRRTASDAPRGLWCGMGACFDCIVTVDGRIGQRACMVKAEPGMVVRSAAPRGDDADPLAVLAEDPGGTDPGEESCDVLVVGGGPAGLAAATEAARALAGRGDGAAPRVVLLDERAQPGGQYFKPLAESHRFRRGRPADRQFAAGLARTADARAAGVEIVSGATVWGAFGAQEVGAIVDGRVLLFRPRQLVLAPGAYERPVPIPGWTLPGVMTTGAVQTLARAYRVAPGERVLIAGNGPLNLQLAVELLEGGAKVVAVLEAAPPIRPAQWSTLARMALAAPGLAVDGLRYLARLRRAGVTVLWSASVLAAEPGPDGRFARARIATTGGERIIAADALALGYGFVPSSEIARALGCAHRFVDRHLGYLAAETDAEGRSSVPGLFIVGDGAEMGGARVAEARGALAGLAAAVALGARIDPLPRQVARAALARAERFQRALWELFAAPPVDAGAIADGTIICRCEEVTAGAVRAAIGDGFAALGPIKRLTRAGMGRCQGRYCAATLARLAAEARGTRPAPQDFFAPRLPAKPVPAAALAFEQAEWSGYRAGAPPDLLRLRSHPEAAALPAPARACDVLVIGGGVIGTCIALSAARRGLDVLVAERDEVNLQASGANAGSLHVQMLSFDFGPRQAEGGGMAAEMLRIAPRAVHLWQGLAAAAGEDFEIRLGGGLIVAETEAEMRRLEAKVAAESRYGVENRLVDGAELRRIAPHLSERLIGAEFCPLEGKINPLRATYAAMRLAQQAGARFLRGTEVLSLARESGTSGWRVGTSAGEIRAGRVVIAAGAWSPHLGRLVGLDLPIRGAPLQMLVTEPAPPLLGQLVGHAGRHLTLKQAETGGLIIGGGWPAGRDPDTGGARNLRASIQGNLWVARRVLPALAGLHLIRAWAAMNVSVDGGPLLGPVPGHPGLFIAATTNGYTLAPAIGEMMADCLAAGGRPGDELGIFGLARFA